MPGSSPKRFVRTSSAKSVGEVSKVRAALRYARHLKGFSPLSSRIVPISLREAAT